VPRKSAIILALVFLVGCAETRPPVAKPTATGQRYVLLSTAVFDAPDKEPYAWAWVEEGDVPIEIVCRRADAIAPPSVVIKFLPAPRGGEISSWQSRSQAMCRLRLGPD